ncbi:hypothetical protein F4778DRAFT_152287 [Xylariomycetidae sp. FL2044]|nr:hypothetical protein F4778DRAFT_152287 [Xylariomycetidae sp. FL2044]
MGKITRLFTLLAVLAVPAVALNLTTYMPECAQGCIQAKLEDTSICPSQTDYECICHSQQAIGQGSIACTFPACGGPDSRYQLIDAYQKFCADALGSNSSVTSIPSPTSSAVSTTATGTAGAGAGSTTTTGATGATAAADPATPPSSSLSMGAKAGIGVGASVATISIVAGLLSIGFRFGKKRKLRGDGPTDPEASGGPPSTTAPAATGPTSPPPTKDDMYETGDKPLLDGRPIAELDAQHDAPAMAADSMSELPAYEKPIEMSHAPVTAELPDTSWLAGPSPGRGDGDVVSGR